MKIELIRLKFNDIHSYKYKPFKYCCDEIQNDKAIVFTGEDINDIGGEYEDDIQFWGCNIPNEVKIVIDSANESVDKSFDNEDQKQAYHLGVENTLSVLKQLLDEGLSRDSITFYYPNAATTEEMDIENINQWLETLPYK